MPSILGFIPNFSRRRYGSILGPTPTRCGYVCSLFFHCAKILETW